MPAESRLSSYRIDGPFVQQTRRYGVSARVAPPMQGTPASLLSSSCLCPFAASWQSACSGFPHLNSRWMRDQSLHLCSAAITVMNSPSQEGGTVRVRRMGPSVVWVLLLAGFLLSAGCIGPLQQWGEETTFRPKATSFAPATLKHEQVAVLNAVVGFGLEGFAHQVSRSLSSALDQRPTLITALPVHEALNRINRGELGEEYAAMVADYVRTGILNRAGLQKIGQAIHTNYVFQPSLASFNQSMSGRFSFFGLRVLQTRVTMLRMSLQLWDTRTGEIVWESSGEATLAGEDVREFRIPFDEIARRLWAHMLDDLFKDVPVE